MLKSNNNSTYMTNRGYRYLKKIKLNKKSNSQRSLNKSQKNVSNKTIEEILENADKIMKERLRNNCFKKKSLLSNEIINKSKEICQQNYTIRILKEKRNQINKKEFFINNFIKKYEDEYEIAHKKFSNFIEEVKCLQYQDEVVLYSLKHKREELEKLYEKERQINSNLNKILEQNIKEFYKIKEYASFLQSILGKKCIYDDMPEIKPRERNYEEILNLIINKYEKVDKYNKLPEELNNNELLSKQFMIFEEGIIAEISNEDFLNKNNQNFIQKTSIKELEQLKKSKLIHEQDLNSLKQEKKKIDAYIEKYKVYKDENILNYGNLIIELGKEIGTELKLPKKLDISHLNLFVLYAKKTLDCLTKKEIFINKKIIEIGNVYDNGSFKEKEILRNLIVKKRRLNKMEKHLEFQKKQQMFKEKENKRIFEKANKIVVKGRLVTQGSPLVKDKSKIKIKKISRKSSYNYNLNYQCTTNKIDETDK